MNINLRIFTNMYARFDDANKLFTQSLARNFPKSILMTSFMIFVVTFAVYSRLTTETLVNGDAAHFAQRISEGDLASESVHIGYYILGYLFSSFFHASPILELNLLNCLLAGMSTGLIFLISYVITRNHLIASVAALFLSTNYIFILNSLYAEIYISQLFFLLLAICLWLLNRPAFSGVCYACAFLITPSTIFAAPMFFVLNPRRKNIVIFSLIAGSIVLFVLLPHLNNYLSTINDKLNNDKLLGIDPVVKEIWEIIPGFFFYIPLLLLGILRVIKNATIQLWGWAIFSLWFVSLLMGEKFGDVPVQLPAYSLFCVVAAIGFCEQMRSSHPYSDFWRGLRIGVCFITLLSLLIFGIVSIPTLVVFLFVVLLYLVSDIFPGEFSRLKSVPKNLFVVGTLALILVLNGVRVFERVNHDTEELVEYRETILDMNRVASPNYLVIGNWHDGMRFEYYVFGKTYTGRWIDTDWLRGSWGASWEEKAQEQFQKELLAGNEVWVLGDYPEVFTKLTRYGYVVTPFRKIYQATSVHAYSSSQPNFADK